MFKRFNTSNVLQTCGLNTWKQLNSWGINALRCGSRKHRLHLQNVIAQKEWPRWTEILPTMNGNNDYRTGTLATVNQIISHCEREHRPRWTGTLPTVNGDISHCKQEHWPRGMGMLATVNGDSDHGGRKIYYGEQLHWPRWTGRLSTVNGNIDHGEWQD